MTILKGGSRTTLLHFSSAFSVEHREIQKDREGGQQRHKDTYLFFALVSLYEYLFLPDLFLS